MAVVADVTIRRRMAELMQPVWDGYIARGALGVTPYNSVDDREPAGAPEHVPYPLLDDIDTVPVVLAVAADLRRIAAHGRQPRTAAADRRGVDLPVLLEHPLGARERGLGGVMTTFLSRVEPEAAPELGLPEHHALAATIFLGVPERQVTKLRREPVERFTTRDRFDGPAFNV